MTHAQVAKMVRERKELYPHLYCADKRCLWGLARGPCPKHPVVREGHEYGCPKTKDGMEHYRCTCGANYDEEAAL